MSFKDNLRRIRLERRMTQEVLAEKLDVTFQAVSSWERGEYLPETEKLLKLTDVLDVSVSALVNDSASSFSLRDRLFDPEHMKTFIKATARENGLSGTLKALSFAEDAHEGQKRKNTDVPYIYHPLMLACHAIALGIRDDDVISACLLHDVVEDCGKEMSDLPVSDRARKLVQLLTHGDTEPSSRQEVMDAYYRDISRDPDASLIKCLDRCHNLSTMSYGLSNSKQIRMITETERYYPALLDVIKNEPRYNDAAWLLNYQINSMLDIYKRMI